MIGSLDDPYSQYLTSEEFKDSLQASSGEFEGIGATIGTVDASGADVDCTTLGRRLPALDRRPDPGSPAEKAGVLPATSIDEIDGASLDGLTVDAARNKVRGPKDTAVVLTIQRGTEAPFDLDIVRAVIVTPEVETKSLADGAVGYIRLAGFSDHAAERVRRGGQGGRRRRAEAAHRGSPRQPGRLRHRGP